MAALARISYDFGPSTSTKARLASLENNAHFFSKGYGRPPGAKSVLDPRVNEVMVFEDFFTVGLRMPPHPVLVDILRKF
jgi:tRNA A37 threonylcarbamoyladenosine synthetase subunit TsaC/SUA5/YrdC